MSEAGFDGNGAMSSYQNMSHTLENRYGLCNLSRYASLPFCGNKTAGNDDFRPDYSHGFAMQRIISIVVGNLSCVHSWIAELLNMFLYIFQRYL